MRKGAARHTKPHDKRPARKSCGAPSEPRPARKPQSTQPESWLPRKPITASDERAKPQTDATQAKRKPPDIMAHRAAQRRGGGFRYVRKRSNAAAAQHVRQESHLQNGRRGCSGARRTAFAHRARAHRHELPYFETIHAQRHSRGVPCVRGALRWLPQSRHHALGRTLTSHSRKANRKGAAKSLGDSSKASISLPKADALTNRRQKRKMRDHQCYDYGKFLASRRATRVSKPWDLLNARSV